MISNHFGLTPYPQKKTSKFVRLFKQGENTHTHTHFFGAILSESHFFMLSIPTATHTHKIHCHVARSNESPQALPQA